MSVLSDCIESELDTNILDDNLIIFTLEYMFETILNELPRFFEQLQKQGIFIYLYFNLYTTILQTTSCYTNIILYSCQSNLGKRFRMINKLIISSRAEDNRGFKLNIM